MTGPREIVTNLGQRGLIHARPRKLACGVTSVAVTLTLPDGDTIEAIIHGKSWTDYVALMSGPADRLAYLASERLQ